MTDPDMKETIMTTYTEQDFTRAEFARHPADGRIAARFDDDLGPWCTEDDIWLSDEGMADRGWVPVREADENDSRVERLKRHQTEVDTVTIGRQNRRIQELEAQVKSLSEQAAAQPITLDALHEEWENAEVADECKEGDVLIYWHPSRRSDRVEAWVAEQSGRMGANARILHRAPKREPWQDLADVLRAHTGEPDPDETAKMLHERGVRMTEEMSEEYA